MSSDVNESPTGPTAVPPVEVGGRVPVGLHVKGRYRIVRELGVGAFGDVWVAEDEATGHPVAVRFLPRGLVGSHLARAIHRTARSIIGASTAHPGLVRVLEFGEVEDGRPFVAMELVTGRRLSEMLTTGKPMDVSEALRLALDVGGSVETLHNLGLVHGALRPCNVMVLEDGRVKLMDIELIGLRDAQASKGLLAVEPPAEYLSPEQIRRVPANEKTDIYAFGVMLYEMLSGAPPFLAPVRDAILSKQLTETPTPLRRRRRAVPGAVESAVTLTLCKQPELRPLMQNVLNRLWAEAHAPVKRSRRTAVVVSGSVVAASIAVVALWGLAPRLLTPHPSAPRSLAQPEPPRAQPAPPGSQATSPRAQPAPPGAQPTPRLAQPVPLVAQPTSPLTPPVPPVTQPTPPRAQPAPPVAQAMPPRAQPVPLVAQPTSPLTPPAPPVTQPTPPRAQPALPVTQPTSPRAQPAPHVAQQTPPRSQPALPVTQPAPPSAALPVPPRTVERAPVSAPPTSSTPAKSTHNGGHATDTRPAPAVGPLRPAVPPAAATRPSVPASQPAAAVAPQPASKATSIPAPASPAPRAERREPPAPQPPGGPAPERPTASRDAASRDAEAYDPGAIIDWLLKRSPRDQ